MRFFQIGPRRYGQFEALAEQPGLTHAFSTRPDDLSPAGGAGADERAERRRQMAADFGFDPLRLHCCVQTHRGRIAIVDELDDADERLEGFDAAVSNVPGVALMTFSADCPLVLLHDPVRQVVGVAHASWRCTVSRLTERLAVLMVARFGSDCGQLHAGIGPGVGPDRYQVGSDVFEAAAGLTGRERFFQVRDGRLYFDLWEANRDQLLRIGLRRENIEVARICTVSRTDLFYSRRGEGPDCGRFGLLAGLQPP